VFVLNIAVFAGIAMAGRFVYGLIGVDFFKRQGDRRHVGEVGAALLGELKRAAGAVYQIHGTSRPPRHERAEHAPWLGDGSISPS